MLFGPVDPRNPINRRGGIIVMTRQAERDALKSTHRRACRATTVHRRLHSRR